MIKDRDDAANVEEAVFSIRQLGAQGQLASHKEMALGVEETSLVMKVLERTASKPGTVRERRPGLQKDLHEHC